MSLGRGQTSNFKVNLDLSCCNISPFPQGSLTPTSSFRPLLFKGAKWVPILTQIPSNLPLSTQQAWRVPGQSPQVQPGEYDRLSSAGLNSSCVPFTVDEPPLSPPGAKTVVTPSTQVLTYFSSLFKSTQTKAKVMR